jgi:hypothetical protein
MLCVYTHTLQKQQKPKPELCVYDVYTRCIHIRIWLYTY